MFDPFGTRILIVFILAPPIHIFYLMQVSQLPEKDELSWSKKQLLAKVDVCMGGRVAEELIFGKDSITTG